MRDLASAQHRPKTPENPADLRWRGKPLPAYDRPELEAIIHRLLRMIDSEREHSEKLMNLIQMRRDARARTRRNKNTAQE